MPCLVNLEFPQRSRISPFRQIDNRRRELRCKVETTQNEGSHRERHPGYHSHASNWKLEDSRPYGARFDNARHWNTLQIDLLPWLTKLAKISDIPLPRPLNPKNVTTGCCLLQLGKSYTPQEESSNPDGHVLLSSGGSHCILCPSFKQRFEPQLGHDSRRDRIH